jgi:hypothetical protein
MLLSSTGFAEVQTYGCNSVPGGYVVEVYEGWPNGGCTLIQTDEGHVIGGGRVRKEVQNGFVRYVDIKTGGKETMLTITPKLAGKNAFFSTFFSNDKKEVYECSPTH